MGQNCYKTDNSGESGKKESITKCILILYSIYEQLCAVLLVLLCTNHLSTINCMVSQHLYVNLRINPNHLSTINRMVSQHLYVNLRINPNHLSTINHMVSQHLYVNLRITTNHLSTIIMWCHSTGMSSQD